MMIKPRETVILADDFYKMIEWYKDVLNFKVLEMFEDDYHYCNLKSGSGFQIGIADANEMGVEPVDRMKNTVLLQFQVADVKNFFEYLSEKGGTVTFGPSFDEKYKFWYGGACDLEGNPFWVVDDNCV